MAQPTKLPQWDATGNIIEPTSGQKAAGFAPGGRLPAQYMNWWKNNVYQWMQYLQTFSGQTLAWSQRQTFRAGAAGPNPSFGSDLSNKSYVDNALHAAIAALPQSPAGTNTTVVQPPSGFGGTPPQLVPANEPAWKNGTWSNGGSGQQPLYFWKDEIGYVNIVGTITPMSVPNAGTALFVLPSGFTPDVAIPIVLAQYPAGATAGRGGVCGTILSSGVCVIDAMPGGVWPILGNHDPVFFCVRFLAVGVAFGGVIAPPPPPPPPSGGGSGGGSGTGGPFAGDNTPTPRFGAWAWSTPPASAIVAAGFQWFETGYPGGNGSVNATLTNGGCRPFAYINMGEVDPSIEGEIGYTGPHLRTNPDWPTYLIDVTDPSWRAWILRRVDQAWAEGARGIKWDVPPDTNEANPGEGAPSEAAVFAALASMAATIRSNHPGIKFIWNQYFDFGLAHPEYIDGIETEGLFSNGYAPLQPWNDPFYWGKQYTKCTQLRAKGIPILCAEYEDPFSGFAQQLYDAIIAKNFVPYITNDHFELRGWGLNIPPGW